MQRAKRVLVVDYDPQFLVTLEQVFQASGFSTVTTWDLETAFEFLETRGFDFLVLGDRPPKLDAYRIVRQMHMRGIDCRYFTLDRDRGLEDLIDRIRNTPVPLGCASESAIDSRVPIPALAG